MSVQELAESWGVCTATIYALAKAGSLPSLRVGNSIRFRPEDVEVYLVRRQGAGSTRSSRPASVVPAAGPSEQ